MLKSTCQNLGAACAILALLIAGFILQVSLFLAANSQTFDEAVHVTAGQRYLGSRDWQFNREHPPLTKLLSALPAYLAYHLPSPEPTSNQWSAGSSYLYSSTQPAEKLLALARISNVILGALTIGLIAGWSWQLWGAPGALLSSGLAAFDPNLIAHSGVAATDMGATFFFMLTLYLLWRYVRQPRWLSLALIGIALGGALGAKFSTITLLPTIGVVLLARPLLRTGQGESTRGQIQGFGAAAGAIAFIALIAEPTLWACYLGGDLSIWLDGLQDQMRHQEAGHPAYFFGSYGNFGWFYYFPVAFLIKTPLATLLALAGALACWRKFVAMQPEMSLVIGVAVSFFALAACLSQVTIGVRHLLPGYALMFVPIGVLTTLPFREQWQRLLCCAALVSGAAMASLSVAPCQLAFFNLAVGGPRQGYKYLSDSNLDWGQDLEGLADWLEDQGNPTIYLAYFGSAPPATFGIKYQSLPTFGNSPPEEAWRVPWSKQQELLAISVTNLQGTYLTDHGMYRWLFDREPVARIGNSIWVYNVAGDAAAHRHLERIYRHASMMELADREQKKIDRITE
jgi:4-amino-4-deoxy-L-arabinose transferase-like glycosyltransferase